LGPGEEARTGREANHDGKFFIPMRLCLRHMQAPFQLRSLEALREQCVEAKKVKISILYVKKYLP
jgi:hypothetical protein